MKVKKRITIVADILVEEDFDTASLAIAEFVNEDGFSGLNFSGQSENFEVLDYISEETIDLEVENET